MLDDSDVEEAGSSKRAADDIVAARSGKSLRCKSGTSNRRMKQKCRPAIKPGDESEPESEFDAGSSLDDSLDDPMSCSNGESDGGGGDGDNTSDTEYSHDENKDVNILPPKSDPGQPTTTSDLDEDKEIMRLYKVLYYEDIVL